MHVGSKCTGFKILRKLNSTGLQHVHHDFVTYTDDWVTLKEEKCKQSALGNVHLNGSS